MSYDVLAKEIIEKIGGPSNVVKATHCMTRLRFTLNDSSKVDVDEIKKINGVVGAVHKSGQFQIIIGTHVSQVFEVVAKQGGFDATLSTEVEEEKKGIFSTIIEAISSIFMPVIGAIAGAGMVKALLALLVAMKLVDTAGQTYYILNFIGDSAFYFLPFLLAVSSANKFKCNPYFAVVLAGVLLHPNLAALKSAGAPVSFFGIPMVLASYSSSVIPIILTVWIMSYVERFAKKVSPGPVKIFLVPMIVLLVTAPIALLAVGPLGTVLGDWMAVGFDILDQKAGWAIPILLGALCPLLVMTGMHYSLMPIQLAQYAAMGYATLMGPGMLASNIAQGGAALAVALKTKDKNLKSIAASSGFTAVMGITEPALYGVNLPLKTPLYAAMIGGGVAGAWAGFTGMRTYASSTAGIFAFPVYIGPEGLQNMWNAVICAVIAFVVSGVVAFILVKVEEPNEVEVKEAKKDMIKLNKKVSIAAPISGITVPLSQVNDEAFASEAMGKGIAIIPQEGRVYSPVTGQVAMVFGTKHAIGLVDESGVEVLIHVGIDTVKLNGEHFVAHVETGQMVKQGDLLVEFDMDAILAAGYEVITPVIITNTPQFLDIVETEESIVKVNHDLLTVIS
ncbi:MAG: beta-glucoside-specific PTS transporter subunit IIABC [Turicibacter sanguinis]|uniref:beta-glucoside-specific PTS transporter subunit IIABC n=1 Tax=Turicibacter sanguinis TaxID=154288 RepID=UPI001B638983|nr:PTS glucose transporter subunit IIA [Turicibacter sp.]